jgi:hypothetical protein
MSLYRDYYTQCRHAYPGGQAALGVYALGVHVFVPGRLSRDDLVRLDDAFIESVHALDAEVERRITDGVSVYHNPDQSVEGMAIQLEPFWDYEPLERVAATLVPQVEETVLGCHGLVNQINLIRSLPSRQPLASSWLWHYDNKPNESFKILVYLTDVSEATGAFEYLRHETLEEVPKIGSSRESPDCAVAPRWPKTRVPEQDLGEYVRQGYRPYRATGPPGTTIVFDNNCIHRATVPSIGHRDALIMSIRPSHKKVRPFVSQTCTGSWSFNAKRWIPELLEIRAAP